MPAFTVAVDIAAEPRRVWQVWTDFERWPEWTPTIQHVKRLDMAPVGVGSSVSIQRMSAQPVVWRMTYWEPRRRFTWATRSTGFTVTADHLVVPRPEGGARAEVSFRVEGWLGWLIGRFLKDLTENLLRTEVSGLKARSEQS
ncbi:MAG: SRPBCC family protein [Chloracidobacterium sp.]|uniref:SRPBCC family protein n=1 Tax=Chloracidobacterium validum TaxID=2821543 RepID=A0ABX8B917_9BACT|nr:SRPBCC family protein [Chloracidobacterium validum]QUW03429.1 SRPBCC family protein [Chloracidobacterium validum]